MPQIKKNLTTANRTQGNLGRTWIVIHNVGTAPTYEGAAYANTQYFKTAYRGASAHAFIDEGDTIWQSVEWSDTAWSVGDGASRNGCYNTNSINIEVCGDSAFTGKRRENLRWLVRKLMGEHGIDAAHVIRHNDVTGKQCPAYYAGNGSARWAELHAYVTAPSEPSGWDGPGNVIAGPTRTETAELLASAKGWSGSCMRTSGDGYADALVGMWVAGSLGANILFGDGGFYLSDGTGGVYLGSDNRFGTNRYTLEFWEKVKGLDIGDTCFVVPGDSFADGIACAWASYVHRIPIVLYEDHKNFRYLVSKFGNAIAVGNSVPRFDGETERIAGLDRAATAVAVAERFGLTWGQPVIATGDNFPDAIAAAQFVGNDVLLFAEGRATIDALKRHRGEITDLYFVGDTASHELCKAAGLE